MEWSPSGDYLQVGDIDFGYFRDMVEVEFKRVQSKSGKDTMGMMRPMFYSGSPYGIELLKLAIAARPKRKDEIEAELSKYVIND